MKKPYKLEILWSNGVLTEVSITETERELIEQYGSEFIILKYSLEGADDVVPESFQVWDEKDRPLFPIDGNSTGVVAV